MCVLQHPAHLFLKAQKVCKVVYNLDQAVAIMSDEEYQKKKKTEMTMQPRIVSHIIIKSEATHHSHSRYDNCFLPTYPFIPTLYYATTAGI